MGGRAWYVAGMVAALAAADALAQTADFTIVLEASAPGVVDRGRLTLGSAAAASDGFDALDDPHHPTFPLQALDLLTRHDGTAEPAWASQPLLPILDYRTERFGRLTGADRVVPFLLAATEPGPVTVTWTIDPGTELGRYDVELVDVATQTVVDMWSASSHVLTAAPGLRALELHLTFGRPAPPSAHGRSVSAIEDAPVTFFVSGSDFESCELSFVLVTPPAHGSLGAFVERPCSAGTPNVDAADLTYTPAPDFSGADSFTFKVSDGTSDSNVATVSIDVAPVNDAPVASPQSVTTAEDTPATITLGASDVDADPLTFGITSPPTHGALTGSGPDVVYTPDADYSGTDSFEFQAHDGQLPSNTARVDIQVDAGDDPPVAAYTIAGPSLNVARWENNVASNLAGTALVSATSGNGLAAIDDNGFTPWQTSSGQTSNQSITLLLPGGRIHAFDRIRLVTGGINGAKEFEVWTSLDNVGYTKVLSDTALNNTNLHQEFSLGHQVEARYVRLLVKNNHGGTAVVVYTFEAVDGDLGGVPSFLQYPTNAALDVNLGSIAAFSSQQSTFPATRVIDGTSTSSWRSVVGQPIASQFVTVRLSRGKSYPIDRVRLVGSSNTSGIKVFHVEVSTDPQDPPAESSFTRVLSGATAPQSNTLLEYPFGTTHDARHVRLVVASNYGGTFAEVGELEVRTVQPPSLSVTSYVNANTTPESMLDDDTASTWRTTGTVDEVARLRLAQRHPQLVDRLVIRSVTGTNCLKDFELWLSETTEDGAYVQVASGSLPRDGAAHELTFAPRRASFAKLLARNNHGGTGIDVASLEIWTAPSLGNVVSIVKPTLSPAAMESPAQTANGAVVTRFSSSTGGSTQPDQMLQYRRGGSWATVGELSEYAVIRLARASDLEAIVVSSAVPLTNNSVATFEVWASKTDDVDASFVKILDGALPFTEGLQTFPVSGPATQDVLYVKYVPRTNHGGTRFLTTFFDVAATGAGRVVEATSPVTVLTSRAELAFDGSVASNAAWTTNTGHTTDQSATVLLRGGLSYAIYGVRITPGGTTAPKDFEVQVSGDGTTFTTAITGTLPQTTTAQTLMFPQPFQGRYVKFLWKNGYSTTLSVREIEVLALDPVAGAALIEVSNESTPALNAVDGVATTTWTTQNGQATNQFLKLLLPLDRTWLVDRVSLKSPNSSAAMRDFEVWVSSTTRDDAAFSRAFAGTMRLDGVPQTFFFPPVRARYVKLVALNTYGATQLQLQSFELVSPEVGDLAPRFLDRSREPDGSIVGFDWTFGDGGTSVERDPAHAYGSPETYDVSLTATSAEGPQATAVGTYLAVAPPAVSFTVTPPVPADGQTATFTDTTPDPTGIVLRQWDFGDGTVVERTAAATTHAYPDPGTYQVTLTVWNTFGGSSSLTLDVVVFNPPPVANDQSFVVLEDTSLPIVLDVTDADGDPLTYQVVPPSHGTLSGTAPNLTYLADRNYIGPDSFSYTVDDGLDQDSATVSITVQPVDGPVAILAMPPSVDPLQPHPVDGSGSFHRFPPKHVVSYRFDFGDGASYVETAVSAPDGAFDGKTSHVYAALGWYTVTLTVLDDAVPPASDAMSARVKVTPRDLVIRDLDASAVSIDPQSLAASGVVSAKVRNLGPRTLEVPFTVLMFEDRNLDGDWDSGVDAALGSTVVAPPVAGFEEKLVSVAVSGTVTSAGAVVWGFADSGNAVAEVKESNNTTHGGFSCQLAPPPPGQLNAGIDFIKTSYDVKPCSVDAVSTPSVVDLDKDGVPEIVFVAYDEGSPAPCPTGGLTLNGVLRAVRGTDGSENLPLYNAAIEMNADFAPTVGDIDHDGYPEIIAMNEGQRLVAFEHDGQLKWTSPVFTGNLGNIDGAATSLADLDLDGTPEIVLGQFAFNSHDGSLRWRGSDGGATGLGRGGFGPLSIVADLDLDGFPEVIAGRSAMHGDGSLYWNALDGIPFNDGNSAVGEFDGDIYPEIVHVAPNKVFMLEHDGTVKWGPVSIPSGGGGEPTIGDVDGDGEAEIGVAAASRYTVFEGDGTIRWSVATTDASSAATGSTIFDFEGDGRAEVVYGDEIKLRIYRGTDGAVLYEVAKSSRTRSESPVVADVDGDGHAEIVAVANDGIGNGIQQGLYVVRGLSDNWASTRRIWNQHSYHIGNVEDDASIPVYELPSSIMHNTYRLNLQPEGDRTGADLIPSYLRFAGAGTSITITARVGNGGGVEAASGVRVAFYGGDPGAGGPLLGTATIATGLPIGAFADVTVTVPGAGLSEVWVAADDDGTGHGAVEECREDNNLHHAPVAFNEAPVANDQGPLSTPEDTPLPITLSATDPDGDALTFSIVDGPTHGTLTGTPPSVTYVPAQNFTGSDSFTFKANDGELDSNVATVTISVGAVNDPPAAHDQTHVIDEDPVQDLSLTLTGDDPEDDPLTFRLVPGSGPSHGTLTGTPPALAYRPDADYYGPDSFRFVANDGQLDSNEATVGITVEPVNDRPIADSQAATTLEDTALSLTLTGSDVDVDPITFRVVSGPGHGSLTGTAPDLVYEPEADFHGGDTFTFVTNDGSEDSLLATVTLTVVPVNDLPEADPQDLTTPEDTPLPITLTGRDRDGDALTFIVVTPPSHGTLTGTEPQLVYEPATDYHGPDELVFKVNDAHGDSSPATVTIMVTSVNDRPVADSQAVSTRESQPVAIQLTGRDVEDDPLVFSVVTVPAHGTLTGTAPDLTYAPAPGFSGVDTFTFRVNDGQLDSDLATVTITVAPNERPVADDDQVTTDEDVAVGITLTGSDGDGDPLTFAVVSPPGNGTLTGTPPNVVYLGAADWNGTDTFTFKVNDGKADSALATVTITVRPVNDAPVANPQTLSTPEDTDLPITLTGSDVEGSGLSYTVVASPSHGTLLGVAPNLTYRPATDFHGDDGFTFKVNDGQADSAPATIGITVVPVNDRPVANGQTVLVDEDASVAITLTGSDPENGTLTYTVLAAPTRGTLTGTAPDLTYAPATDYHGDDSFTFKVNDGQADSDPATVSITVRPVNDRPVATNLTIVTTVGTPVQITLTASDADGDPLSYATTSAPAHGTLSGTAPSLTYTPQAGYVGQDTFTYVASDGILTSLEATVTITVQDDGGNHDPVCTGAAVHPASLWPPNHKMNLIDVLGVSDQDGDALTVTVTQIRQDEPINGLGDGDKSPDAILQPPQVRAERQGPPLGDGRVYHVTFMASDGRGGTCTGTATLCVPHDQNGPSCVDGGATYNSTGGGLQ